MPLKSDHTKYTVEWALDAEAYIKSLEQWASKLENGITSHMAYIQDNDIGSCPVDEDLWALVHHEQPPFRKQQP